MAFLAFMRPETENIINNKSTFTFKKEERLCSKKVIDKLFAEGESFLSFPIKISFIKTTLPSNSPVQAAFSVSKKNFKKAVHRNRIKRLMREAYRLNKNKIYEQTGVEQVAIFFIFIGKELPDYTSIEKGIKKGIKKLIKKLN
ncbi:MAG: ribonuclease P protein component [Bacteroidota bacterium]